MAMTSSLMEKASASSLMEMAMTSSLMEKASASQLMEMASADGNDLSVDGDDCDGRWR